MLEELGETYNSMKKYIETIKQNQSEMKNTLWKKSWLDEANHRINDLKGNVAENSNQGNKKEKKNLKKGEWFRGPSGQL